MTPNEWTALLVLATATSFTPGPNTTLSAALAANGGLRHAGRFVLAVPAGWGLLFGLCALGLGSVVLAVPALRWGILLAGSGYLLWLAWRLAHAAAPSANSAAAPLRVGFMQGVMLQFLNIKAWMLALSIVAGWVAGKADAVERFFWILPVLLTYAALSNFTYALAGTLLREWLAGPTVQGLPSYGRLRGFNRLMATALVLTALWMVWNGTRPVAT